MINTIRSKSDIPNTAGYEFYAVMIDGTILADKVSKNDKGLHTVANFDGMIGWLKLTDNTPGYLKKHNPHF